MYSITTDMFNGSFWAGLALTVCLLLIGHWAPTPAPLPHPLSRLVRYAYGVSSILAGILVWLLADKMTELALGVVLISLAGGLAVAFGYSVDWAVTMIRAGRELYSHLEQREGDDDRPS